VVESILIGVVVGVRTAWGKHEMGDNAECGC